MTSNDDSKNLKLALHKENNSFFMNACPARGVGKLDDAPTQYYFAHRPITRIVTQGEEVDRARRENTDVLKQKSSQLPPEP